jgi:hypothetical protein
VKVVQANKITRITITALSAVICMFTVGCKAPAEIDDSQIEKPGLEAPVAAAETASEPKAKLNSTKEIASPPTTSDQSEKPTVISSRDETFRDAPSCIYTISYAPQTSHEVRWKGNICAELSTDFMSVSDLEKFGKLEELSNEARQALAKNHKQGVFYVEGEFTASIYPQDNSGIPYEMSVAD